jgi:hypothetical protein
MTEPFIGAAASAALGLSPWILPLIAIAAKRKEDAAHHGSQHRVLLTWWRGEEEVRADARAPQHAAIDVRPAGRLDPAIKPD